jgi:hypothetical protein
MVNNNKRRMRIIEIHIQQNIPHSSNKEASIMMMQSTEEKIMINQGRNLEVLHHKKDHSLRGIKIYFMVIVLFVLTLDIRLYIAEHMEEMFIQEIPM